MEIPALVVGVDERVADVVDVQRQARDARGSRRVVRRDARDRHDVGGAVGEPDAGAGVGDLHHVLREIARRVVHVLVRRGDVAARGVVVRPEVRGDDAAARRGEQARQVRRGRSRARIACVVSIMNSNRSAPAARLEPVSRRRTTIGQRGDLLGRS